MYITELCYLLVVASILLSILAKFCFCIWYTTNIVYLKLTDRPTIQPIPDQTTIVGETLSLTCEVIIANPTPDQYIWTSVSDDNFSEMGPVLTIPNIQRRHAGTYRCTAVNTMNQTSGGIQQGSDTEDVVLDVLCMCSLVVTLYIIDEMHVLTQELFKTCIYGNLIQQYEFFFHDCWMTFWSSTSYSPVAKQKKCTEVCSKLKSPETRQVQEILVSALEHLQFPKWDRTRCSEE